MTLSPIAISKITGKPRKIRLSKRIPSNILDEAHSMYLTGKSCLEIGMALKQPVADIKYMARHHGWTAQRDSLMIASKPTVEEQLKVVMATNIVRVAQRNLDTAEQLDDHIHVHLAKKKLGTKSIADLARAALSSSKLAGDIVGLGKATEDAGKKIGPVQWNLAVQVINNPPQANPSPTTITIQATEASGKPLVGSIEPDRTQTHTLTTP